jgi:ActR/RegA family two-component response regulator
MSQPQTGLIVDDDPQILRLVERMLGARNASVLVPACAGSGGLGGVRGDAHFADLVEVDFTAFVHRLIG